MLVFFLSLPTLMLSFGFMPGHDPRPELYDSKPVTAAGEDKSSMGMIIRENTLHSYLYKGERRRILHYEPHGFSDVNNDSVPTSNAILELLDSPELLWATMYAFGSEDHHNIQNNSMLAPFQAPFTTGIRYHVKIAADAANLKVGESYRLRMTAFNEPTGGDVGFRAAVSSGERFVHVVPYPIEFDSAEPLHGSTSTMNFAWQTPDITYWELHHFAIFYNSCNPVLINELEQAKIIANHIPPSETSLVVPGGPRGRNGYYAIVGYDSQGEAIAISESLEPEYSKEGFSLLSPEDGEVVGSLQPVLSWEEHPGSTYTVKISDDVGFTAPLVFEQVASNSFQLPQELPSDNATYYWKVVSDAGTWCNETGWAFGVNQDNQPPSEFGLITPPDMETVHSGRPFFSWEQAFDPGDALRYTLLVAVDPEFSNVVLEQETRSTFHYPTSDLGNRQTYYWKAVVTDSEGLQAESPAVHSFDLNYDQKPGRFNLLAPAFTNPNDAPVLAGLNPTFEWSPAQVHSDVDAPTYTLWYSTDSTFATATQAEGIEETFYTPAEPLIDKSLYYWKVKAVGANGEYRWHNGLLGAFVTESINAPPEAAEPVYPEYDQEYGPNQTINFQWTRPADPDFYDWSFYTFSWATDEDFTDEQIVPMIISENYDMVFAESGTYYWRVNTSSKTPPDAYWSSVGDGGRSTGVVSRLVIADLFAGGSGTEADPFLIESAEHLNNVRRYCEDRDVFFKQTADIDLGVSPWNEGEGWIPIGQTDEAGDTFRGTYDGNGHTISGLTIDRTSDNQGLFRVMNGARIRDVRLMGANIKGRHGVGGLAGNGMGSSITDSHVSGSVKGLDRVGGLVGSITGQVLRCSFAGDVNGRFRVGGLSGTGGHLNYSFSSGSVSGTEDVGGLSGGTQQSVNRSFSATDVTGQLNVGGVAGHLLTGSRVEDSYARGTVEGEEHVGGLVGYNENGEIHNCYATGLVTAEIMPGGLTGKSGPHTLTRNALWDSETSGQLSSDGGNGKTTPEMNDPATFIELGWDFKGLGMEGIWNSGNERNEGYPYLDWQYPDDPGYGGSIPPTAMLTAITGIEGTAALIEGLITNAGVPAGDQHGVCWNTTGMPDINDNKTELGPVGGLGEEFDIRIEGLDVNTKYYVRAYAQNSEGIHYSEAWSFYTLPMIAVAPVGEGTPENPYLIGSLEELYWIGETPSSWQSVFVQTADIDASPTANWLGGEGWKPIGQGSFFRGKYQGGGHIIDGLFIYRPDNRYTGMFGRLNDAEITDLSLTGVSITGARETGGMAGTVDNSLIQNIYLSGSVTGQLIIGGIAGFSSSIIRTSVFEGEVSGGSYAGGIAGRTMNSSIIENAYSTGEVRSTGSYVGGIVGSNNGIIHHCYSNALVAAERYHIGGLVGTSGSSAEVVNGLWDMETSLIATEGAGTGKTSEQMKRAGTYLDAGWDFAKEDGIWAMNRAENGGYPFLRFQDHTAQNIWLGLESDQWEDERNWSELINPADAAIVPSVETLPLINAKTGIGDLWIEPDAGLIVGPSGQLTVDGELVSPGEDPGLIIRSMPTGHGSVIHHSEGVHARVEYYMSASSGSWPGKSAQTDWRYIAPAVAGQCIEEFNQGIPLQHHDLYYWDEAAYSWLNYRGDQFPHQEFEPGTGYLAAYKNEHTLAFSGSLHHGDFGRLNLSKGDYGNNRSGWHLLGNPFTSGTMSGNWTSTGMVATPKLWSEGAYVDAVDGFIPPMTAFFMQAHSPDNSLLIPSSSRRHTPEDKDNPSGSLIVLSVSADGSPLRQRSIVRMEPEVADGFDPRFDSRFLPGYAPGLYAMKGDDRLSVYALASEESAEAIPYVFSGNHEGPLYRIELEKAPSGKTLFLYDMKKGKEHRLIKGTPYLFTSTGNEPSLRFELGFRTRGSTTSVRDPNHELLSIYHHGQTLFVEAPDGLPAGKLEVFDLGGRRVYAGQLKEGTIHSVELNAGPGAYVVRVITRVSVSTERILVR